MRNRTFALTATSAVVVAVLAIAVSPLLDDSASNPPTRTVAPPSSSPHVEQLAQRAAQADLRCPAAGKSKGREAPRTGCGDLQVSRSQVSCSTANRCTVDLVGAVNTGRLVVPIALTVSLIGGSASWQVVEVES